MEKKGYTNQTVGSRQSQTPATLKLILDLLRLGESDLEASRILYYTSHYPQAIFLFQQSTEKTNKAIGLMGELVMPENLLNIRHEQSKVYKMAITRQIELIENLNKLLEPFNDAKNHPLLSIFNITQQPERLTDIIAEIDEFRKLNLSGRDLDGLIAGLWELRESEIVLPNDFNDQMLMQLPQVYDWMEMFGVAGQQHRIHFEKWINLKENQKELFELIKKIIDSVFVFGRSVSYFSLLAIIMDKHSSSPRYPMNGKSPFQIYHANNPIVSRLPELYSFAEEGIVMLKKYQKNAAKE